MRSLLLPLAAALALHACDTAATQTKTRIGYAYDLDTRAPLYREVHTETWDGEILLRDEVRYVSPAGETLAEKQVDYRASSLLPDFTLDNRVSGHREQAVKFADSYHIDFVARRGAAAKTAVVALPPTGVADAGFDRFIVAQWDKLIAGATLTTPFLIPSRLSFFTFRIYQREVKTGPAASGDGSGHGHSHGKIRTIAVEPNNFVLRALTDGLTLDYEYDAPRLIRFVGPSNMRDNNGDNYRVLIHFPRAGDHVAGW